jgi:putative Holliday junction resolvase
MARVLGIDYGRVRVGVAVADLATGLANPLATLDARTGLLPRLREIIRSEGVALVVLGRPLRARGEPGTLDGEILHFAAVLRREGLEVEFQDEGGSSREAARLLAGNRGRTGVRSPRDGRRARLDGELDRTAAALLLQDWLDARAASPTGDRAC